MRRTGRRSGSVAAAAPVGPGPDPRIARPAESPIRTRIARCPIGHAGRMTARIDTVLATARGRESRTRQDAPHPWRRGLRSRRGRRTRELTPGRRPQSHSRDASSIASTAPPRAVRLPHHACHPCRIGIKPSLTALSQIRTVLVPMGAAMREMIDADSAAKAITERIERELGEVLDLIGRPLRGRFESAPRRTRPAPVRGPRSTDPSSDDVGPKVRRRTLPVARGRRVRSAAAPRHAG